MNKVFTNLELAKLFRRIAAAYTILGENKFKIIAYENAATSIEHSTSELKDLWTESKLTAVPGLGTSMIDYINELFKTGHSAHFDNILSKINPAIFPLLDVPGVGPKKAQKLVDVLCLNDPKTVFLDLEKAAKEHKVEKIPTFGIKSEAEILEGLARYRKGSIKEKRMTLPLADSIADDLISYLKERLVDKYDQIDKLGSLRRQVATIGDIDLAISTDYLNEALDAFIGYPKKVNVIERGDTKASILLASGRQADLRVTEKNGYGAMLQYFTGSKYHNIKLRDYALKKGFSLNEYGVKKLHSQNDNIKKFQTEKELYNFFGLDYIPPEIREDTGEIEIAKNKKVPTLLEVKDIKGDLQMHSNFDQETSHDSGTNSMEELQEQAKLMNYEYIGVTNHNPSSKVSLSGQIYKIKKQKEIIDKLNLSKNTPKLLNLLEVDILPDGNLATSDEILSLLDGCLVSIHSNMGMNKEQMTKRILKGLSNPNARILAHPTGRLLGERESLEADWEKIFLFCKQNDKAIEINCHPNRLDLPDNLVREGLKYGIKFSLGTDSHRKEDLINIRYGVSVARRGWLSKNDVINTLNYDKILMWFRKRF